MLNSARRSSAPIVLCGDGGHVQSFGKRKYFSEARLQSLHQHYPNRYAAPPPKKLACKVSYLEKHRLQGNLRCFHGPNCDLGPLCTIIPVWDKGTCENHMDFADSRDGHQGLGGGGGGGGSGSGSGPYTVQIDNTPLGDSEFIERHYQTVLQSDPQNPLLLQNYAQFLLHVKHDHAKAEEYYERAILASPYDGRVLATYAELLWDSHRDSDRASMYFEQALKTSPDDSYVTASYASFLWQSESNLDLLANLPLS